jgi:hypothetical protein
MTDALIFTYAHICEGCKSGLCKKIFKISIEGSSWVIFMKISPNNNFSTIQLMPRNNKLNDSSQQVDEEDSLENFQISF